MKMSQLDLAWLRVANRQLAARRSQEIGKPADPNAGGWMRALVVGVEEKAEDCADLRRLESETCFGNWISRNNSTSETLTFFPDVGLAMLREEKAAIGRIYLLLRHIDHGGKGWVSIEDARSLLTKKDAPLRVCGWRQLRNLLRAGQGVFWERDKERVWLRSLAKVAVALGVERMAYRPIALPVTTLLGDIGTVRAHFYTSFHSSRHDPDHAKPIARDTLAKLSGVGRDSQRSYERQTGIVAKSNFAVGQVASADTHKAACWQRGDHVFIFTDTRGAQGKQGQKYLAWQLPNSYHGVHQQKPRTQRRRINRQLTDLLTNRATGNGLQRQMQRYFVSGSDVVDERADSAEIYLRQGSFWHCL